VGGTATSEKRGIGPRGICLRERDWAKKDLPNAKLGYPSERAGELNKGS